MLAEGVPNHLLFLDRELRILFANDVFLEASGWSSETMLPAATSPKSWASSAFSSVSRTTSARSRARP